MAKYYGRIGYAEYNYERPGITEENIVTRTYYGDVLQNLRRLQSTDEVNDDLTLSNRISILSDPYLLENFHRIRFAEYMGVKWKVSSVDVQYPRLILTLGGVYNEATGASFDFVPDDDLPGNG